MKIAIKVREKMGKLFENVSHLLNTLFFLVSFIYLTRGYLSCHPNNKLLKFHSYLKHCYGVNCVSDLCYIGPGSFSLQFRQISSKIIKKLPVF